MMASTSKSVLSDTDSANEGELTDLNLANQITIDCDDSTSTSARLDNLEADNALIKDTVFNIQDNMKILINNLKDKDKDLPKRKRKQKTSEHTYSKKKKSVSPLSDSEEDGEVEISCESEVSDLEDWGTNDMPKGGKIDEELAQAVKAGLSNPIPEGKIKEIIQDHPEPENCPFLKVPAMNNEIWKVLPKFQRKKDVKSQNLQELTMKSLTASIQMKNLMKQARKEGKTIDTKECERICNHLIKMNTKTVKDLNNKRREETRPFLNDELKALCNKNQGFDGNEMLFGDNLPQKIEELHKVSKTTHHMSNNKGKSKNDWGGRYHSTTEPTPRHWQHKPGGGQTWQHKQKNQQRFTQKQKSGDRQWTKKF